jgi:hypothetical protein
VTAPELLAVVLDALADRIAVRIGVVREPDVYDSRNLPPRCTRRRFVELCRAGRVAGAWREGVNWCCSREAWEAARVTRKQAAAPRPVAPLEAQADRLLTRAGLRVVGRARSPSGGRQ